MQFCLQRFPIAPVTFVGDQGIRCTPSLVWGSSPRPGWRLPVADPARPKRPITGKSAAGREQPLRLAQLPPHPALGRPRPATRAAPLRSTPGAPATAPGRSGGNPAPRHSRLEGDPHCDRSTLGRRPLPHPPGPRDPTRERQPASGSLPGA